MELKKKEGRVKMKQMFLKVLKTEKVTILLTFFVPVLIMMMVYAKIGIYWGSDRSILASDAFAQFSNFHASFRNMLLGKQSYFYTWNSSIGLNYLALAAYYLGGLFTPLVILFPNEQMPDALYVLTLLKIGCASLSFWVYAKNTFRLPKHLLSALAIVYSLMSFILAYSELIMWLDTFVYLPLIILGINRLMDQHKPTCLFVSYLLMFISNFYMAFMVGLFSVLYFIARMLSNWQTYRKRIGSYLLTSILAGLTSTIITLPVLLDLRANGEALTKITHLKTEATNIWDLLIKNMIGVFDTTRYGSIPFIYIGLIPLIFGIYFFVSKFTPKKQKFIYAGFLVFMIASFYLEPLNLFWQGMHSPNMFLFRFSFTFSFLVIMLACYGLERYHSVEKAQISGIIIGLMALFILAKVVPDHQQYPYVTSVSFYTTLAFLALYLISIVLFHLQRINFKQLASLLAILMCVEATINAQKMVDGILKDWNYASRSLYSAPYKRYQEAVNQTKPLAGGTFYRTETLAPISPNDSINYGFSGVSQFSSIRNRNASSLLNDLGFRSRGTNLNIRYQNNTLLADALIGIKYNISNQLVPKFGFKNSFANERYQVYENQYALPLGILTNSQLYQTKFPKNDNLGAQRNLFNALSGLDQSYFSFITPEITEMNNTKIIQNGQQMTFQEIEQNKGKIITWKVRIPARTQAYLSLYPSDFSQLKSSSATVSVGGTNYKSQIDITGQYYNLGYYDCNAIVTFRVEFYGSPEVSMFSPQVLCLNTKEYLSAVKKMKQKGVAFTVKGRKASANVTAKKDQVLYTSIPYDKGWKAHIDGKKVAIKPFKKGFITIEIPKGTHKIELKFLPQGFMIGIFGLLIGSVGFIYYLYWLNKKQRFRLIVTKEKA